MLLFNPRSLWKTAWALILASGAALLLASCASYGPAQPNARGTVYSTYSSGPKTSISYGFRGPPDRATAVRSVTANGVEVLMHPGQCMFSLVWDANQIQFLNTIIILDGKEYVSPVFVMDQPALTPERQVGLARRVWLMDDASSGYLCTPLLNPEQATEDTKLFFAYKEDAAQTMALAMVEYAVRSKQAQTEEEAAQLFTDMGKWGDAIEAWTIKNNKRGAAKREGRPVSPLEPFVRPLPLPAD